MSRADDTTIATGRLILMALRPEDADELIDVLADERLHELIGGHPAAAALGRRRAPR